MLATKTSKVIESLGQRLRKGEWAASAPLPPVALLSTEYKVSPGTIALAVKSLEKEGLVKVLPRQGVFSTGEVRMSSGGPRFSMIGLYGRYASRKGSNSYMSVLTDGILNAAQSRNGAVLMLPQGKPGELRDRKYFQDRGVEGIVFLGGDFLDMANGLREQGFPVITANMPLGASAMNFVSYDLGDSVRRMTERFTECGHRRIAVLSHESSTTGLFDSVKVNFIQALCEAGIHYDPTPYWREIKGLENYNAVETVRPILEELLALPEPPTALFARGALAKPVMHCLAEMGVDVPSDLSVIGSAFDDEESAVASGFVIRNRDLGERLIEGIYRIIENPFHTVQQLVPLTYLDKGTVAKPPQKKG